MKYIFLPCTLALSLVFLGGPAWAQQDQLSAAEKEDKARALYNAGVTFYESGRYVASIEAFEEAYRLSQHHVLLLNIASAYEKLGNPSKALEALDRFVPHAPPERLDALQKRRAALQTLVQAKNKPEPTPPKEPDPQPDPPTPKTTPPKEEGSNLVAWSTVIAGGVLLATGGTLLTLGELDHRDLESRLEDRSLNVRFPNQRQQAQTLDDEANQKKLFGLIFLSAGALATATGGLLFALDFGDDEGAVTLNLAPQPTGGVALYGNF